MRRKRLDDLDAPLRMVVGLIRRLEYPLAKAMAVAEVAAIEEVKGELNALSNRLVAINLAASGIPQRRRGIGKRKIRHGKNDIVVEFDLKPVQAMMDVLARYWKDTLARQFTQNHTAAAWECNDKGLPAPTRKATKAVRFAYAIIEHIAPGQGGSLKTVAREYISRPDYGK